MGLFTLRVEHVGISLLGAREENQDRVSVAVAEHAALMLVVDGMGGHAEGSRAAEMTKRVVLESFWQVPHPLFDPLGFLHLTPGRAHEELVRHGKHLPVEQRPRATCAVCIVQRNEAWWAHIGDSRIYHIRGGSIVARTRDHTHVEQLLREGLITPDQAQRHPLRNYVECCLGGDPALPEMSLCPRRTLEPNDVLLVCTDGMWSGLKDEELAAGLSRLEVPLREALAALCKRAVARNGRASDNTSAAALRWLGR